MRILSVLSLCICLISCNNLEENRKGIQKESSEKDISKKDISNLDYIDFILDEKADKSIESWKEYYEFNTVIIDLKKGDLSYLEDNHEVLEAKLKDLKAAIPDQINTPLILARLVAFDTKMYKLESIVNLSTTTKTQLIADIKDVLISFSNLNLQINKKFEKESQNIQKPG